MASHDTSTDSEQKPPPTPDAFPVLASKSAEAQQCIEAVPDEWWEPKKAGDLAILDKAGYLLVSGGQRSDSARLTAVASDSQYVGNGWMPVTGPNAEQSKAAAVYLNSTPGRLQIMRNFGKTRSFPFYNAASWREVRTPDLTNPHILSTLSACWEATRTTLVPQFRDGYTPVRRQWDEAVCEALGWDIDKIAGLGELLAKEPHVAGVGYGQYRD